MQVSAVLPVRKVSMNCKREKSNDTFKNVLQQTMQTAKQQAEKQKFEIK